MVRHFTGLVFAAAALAALAGGGAARACEGAGVITRIEGRPQDIIITRTDGGVTSVVNRPRVLEVVCRRDSIRATGASYVVLSIDGVGAVKVDRTVDYSVPSRSGGPSMVGNAYQALSDQVMPDMKRLPWNVRLKGEGDDFGFALPALTAGGQQIQSGSRTLLVRLVGGVAPYKVEIRDAKDVVVASRTSPGHEVIIPNVNLSPGAYRLTASDTTPRSLDAVITAVSDEPPRDGAFTDLPDAEIRAAVAATALARAAPATWSFEAEQQLQTAPVNGLDRDKVYELIESYGAD